MTTVKAIKSVSQNFVPDTSTTTMMETFRQMVNHCIRIGLEKKVITLKRLSTLAYQELEQYPILSYYKIHAISRAAGILSNTKQSLARGIPTKTPYLKKPLLVSCYGFKFEGNIFKIPLGNKTYLNIQLNDYTRKTLKDPNIKVRSFVLTLNSISISYFKMVEKIECSNTAGIDRNLRNLSYGNCEQVIQFNLSKTVQIAENTKSIISSFKRNDLRIRKQIVSKYGERKKNRVEQTLHIISKTVVDHALKNHYAIVFEDIRQIRRLYKKGNGQGKKFRHIMNTWPFFKIKKQIEYKSNWNGIPIIQLSKKETKGTSKICPACGKRLQDKGPYDGTIHERDLWCIFCQRWLDRDVVAVMNQSLRGLSRFDSSKGDAGEAMKRNVEKLPRILRVDASKLFFIK